MQANRTSSSEQRCRGRKPGVWKGGSTHEDKGRGVRNGQDTEIWEPLQSPGEESGLGLGMGEAAKVPEQAMEMANLRATRMAMATKRAVMEMLWPSV